MKRREASELIDKVRDFESRETASSTSMAGGLPTSRVSRLAKAGIAPKLAQRLARHSDVNLTLSRYPHVYLPDQHDALDSLPGLPKVEPADRQATRATGTDGPPKADDTT